MCPAIAGPPIERSCRGVSLKRVQIFLVKNFSRLAACVNYFFFQMNSYKFKQPHRLIKTYLASGEHAAASAEPALEVLCEL